MADAILWSATWIALFYVAANLVFLRVLIRDVQPLALETGWLLLTLLPSFALLFVYFCLEAFRRFEHRRGVPTRQSFRLRKAMETDSFPLGMQIACVEREIRMREQVYPGQVARKKMSQRNADIETSCMRAVLGTLQKLKEKEG